MKILKYQLGINGEVRTYRSPKIRRVLDVQEQNGIPCLWIETEGEDIAEEFIVAAIGTGWEVDVTGMVYIGTVQINGYVWHYYMKDMIAD